MTIKELEKVLEDDDLLVRILFSGGLVYELRNGRDVKKHTITSKQFDYLMSKFNFKHLKTEGYLVAKQYYKR